MYKLLQPKPQGEYKKRNVKDNVKKALSSKVGKEMSNPMNYVGGGTIKRIVFKPVELSKRQLAEKALHNSQADEFAKDIKRYSLERYKERKQAQARKALQEQRKNYFLRTTPDQRTLDSINKYRNK